MMMKSGMAQLTPESTPPKPEVLSDKAEQILRGAMQEFATHGYAATSMDRVAAAAGVSKATIYSHFQDKEGLFTALVKQITAAKFSTLFKPENFQGKPRVVLRRLARLALIQMNTESSEQMALIRLIIGESGRFPKLAQIFLENAPKPGIQFLTQYLASCPELNLPDPEATARIVVGAIVYFVQVQVMMNGQEVMPMDSDRLVNALDHLLFPNADPSELDQSLI
jgi:AcrR family transcriptional regulator